MRALSTLLILLTACGGDDEHQTDARPVDATVVDAPIDAAIDATVDAAATCAGTTVGGHCWYKGAVGASCTTVCTNHGGVDPATIGYAGAPTAGARANQANCQAVAAALSPLAFTAAVDNVSLSNDYGCVEEPGKSRTELVSLAATVTTSGHELLARFCACAQ